ncbi:MAG: hypothetical protein V3R82_05400, partial [Candidatus Hydrothermarchaeales archaeon]
IEKEKIDVIKAAAINYGFLAKTLSRKRCLIIVIKEMKKGIRCEKRTWLPVSGFFHFFRFNTVLRLY